jgi:hypothetical protein
MKPAKNSAGAAEDRSTDFGTFNFAESYRHASDRLRLSKIKALSFDAPIRFLYYHSIELYLKSYLQSHGISAAKIKSRYGHRFRKLERGCAKFGLNLDYEDSEVIALIDGDNFWDARYLATGFKTLATLNALARTSDSLARFGYERLREAGKPVRKPLRSPKRY